MVHLIAFSLVHITLTTRAVRNIIDKLTVSVFVGDIDRQVCGSVSPAVIASLLALSLARVAEVAVGCELPTSVAVRALLCFGAATGAAGSLRR